MTTLLEDAARRAQRYLDALPGRAVAPAPQAVARLERLEEPLPEQPHDAAETIAMLDEVVGPATMAMAGPRFFGFVIGGALPATLAANWLAGAWDQNAGFYVSTPGVARLEEVSLRWLKELFGLPRETVGGFVTGATMANFTALAAARHAVLARAGWPVEARGLIGAPEVEVIVGEEVHPSVLKSLGLLGFGRNRVTRVPVDGQGRLRADRLPAVRGPAIVCLQAGNVNTGAFDPIGDVCARLEGSGAWIHVDGAFGLWARVAPSRAALTEGIEHADSWSTDAHKWLNVPYDCGLAFVRDSMALPAAMAITAEYLPGESPHRNPCDYTPELSRRARGVEVWTALRTLGRAGLAEIVERDCALARRFAERLQAAGFEVLNEIVLNQVLVAFGDPKTTQRVIEAVQAEGTCWCGGTVWQNRTAMRISVSSWATRAEDVDASAEAIVRVALREARDRR